MLELHGERPATWLPNSPSRSIFPISRHRLPPSGSRAVRPVLYAKISSFQSDLRRALRFLRHVASFACWRPGEHSLAAALSHGRPAAAGSALLRLAARPLLFLSGAGDLHPPHVVRPHAPVGAPALRYAGHGGGIRQVLRRSRGVCACGALRSCSRLAQTAGWLLPQRMACSALRPPSRAHACACQAASTRASVTQSAASAAWRSSCHLGAP